ncbi:MAG: PLP-dependent aminotransferase family protein [Alphaproteobacteria bacterium]|nr:PLP-dependent aminotransferase family protein [Alphaproteobacteria bacterium]MCB9696255.1 PLP-dependent aminotransferase family protein [Alphaproteobacteria bacterium]
MARVEEVLGDWSAGPGPLQRKLADALRAAISVGSLPPGTRLPAERALAQSLAVSRSTVVAALAALRDEGLVTSRHGSGTRVAVDARRRLPRTDPSLALRRNVVAEAFVDPNAGAIDLLGASVEALPSIGPALFAEAMADLGPHLSHSGYHPFGLPELREVVAAHLAHRGAPTRPSEVLITNGAQQGLALAASLLLRPGDTVLVETPTYLTAIDLLRGTGARLAPVATGPEGVDLDALREAIERHAPAMVYLVPTFHNPLGTVMPASTRRAVAALASRHGFTVVEDEALAELSFTDDPVPPPIAAFAEPGTVLTLGSTSKVLWGGLRVGWVRGSDELVRRLGRLKTVADLGSAVPSQVVAVRLLRDLPRYQRERRALLIASRDAVVAELAEHLPSFDFAMPAGGLSLWLRLPCGNASELAQVARRHGVAIVPGHLAGPDGGHGNRVRLPITRLPGELGEGVRRLARAWEAYQPTAERRRTALEVLV